MSALALHVKSAEVAAFIGWSSFAVLPNLREQWEHAVPIANKRESFADARMLIEVIPLESAWSEED